LTNAVAIGAGYSHGLAVKADGTVVAWGDNYYGRTNPPAGLSNVVAVAGGSGFSVALGDDLAPQADQKAEFGPANRDLVIALSGSDINGDLLNFRILSLPAQGALYQFNAGSRGAAILSANTLVLD